MRRIGPVFIVGQSRPRVRDFSGWREQPRRRCRTVARRKKFSDCEMSDGTRYVQARARAPVTSYFWQLPGGRLPRREKKKRENEGPKR